MLYAFDPLPQWGRLPGNSLDERREWLIKIKGGAGPGISLSEEVDADGEAFLAVACVYEP